MTNESPCVLAMIKDVRSVYESMQDGSGIGENINIYFLASDQKFVVSQDALWLEPTGDGGYVNNSDTMWEEAYDWNEMTRWYFSNRPFHIDEFKLHNEAAIKAAYVGLTQEELESTSIEEFTRFLFNNEHFGRDLDIGYCHGDLSHKLF